MLNQCAKFVAEFLNVIRFFIHCSEKYIVCCYDIKIIYFNGFAQSVARQRFDKHVPTRNNRNCVSVDECYSLLLGSSQRGSVLAIWQSRDLCFCVVRADHL
jgi:hypothetical protein